MIISGGQDDKAILWRIDPYERVHTFEGWDSQVAHAHTRCHNPSPPHTHPLLPFTDCRTQRQRHLCRVLGGRGIYCHRRVGWRDQVGLGSWGARPPAFLPAWTYLAWIPYF
jgi:hypothetical protein